MDILTSFVLTATAYSKHTKESGSDTTNEAKASAGIFGAVGILYALCIIIYYCYKLKQKNCSKLLSEHGHGLLIAFGGLCYYIGDNLPPLIREYGVELDCDQECAEGVQIFGIVMLGTATVTYLPVLTDVFSAKTDNNEKELKTENEKKKNAVPTYTNKELNAPMLNRNQDVSDKMTEKETTPVNVVVLLLLAKMTNLDLVYTAIERAASNKCNEKVMGGAWAYYAIYFFAFFAFCLYRMWTYEKEGTKKNTTAQRKTTRCTHSLAILIAFLITAFAASYILADNRLPLACSGIAETNLYPQGIIRLVLWGVTVMLGVLVFICWRTYAYFRRYVELGLLPYTTLLYP